MIVIDASVVVRLLTDAGHDVLFERLIRGEAVAPQILGLEVLKALRNGYLRGDWTEARATEAAGDLLTLPIRRYSHDFLLPRIWQLRNNITAYDASYVALAELLNVPLLTRDARLARSAGHSASIEYID
ncbi:MAG TPA: type II toxin-antitoxin system VapC family toxin [Thermoanaerobaculia bacterium]|jgi:predicted nucleic acid-binding protein